MEAQISGFQANMRAADALLSQVQKQIKETELDAVVLSKALTKIDIANSQITHAVANLKAISKELGSTRDSAKETALALGDVKVPASAVAETVAAIAVEKQALKELENQAQDTSRAMQRVGSRDTFGRFLPAGGPTAFAGGGPGAAMNRYDPSNLLLQNRVFAQDAQYARNVVRGATNNNPIFADPKEMARVTSQDLRTALTRQGLFGQQGKDLLTRFFSDAKRRLDTPGGLFGTSGMFGQGGGGGGRSVFSQIAALGPGGQRATGGALAAGITTAAPLVASLLPAVGVVGTLPAIGAGGIAALGALKLAFEGVGAAIGGNLKEYNLLNDQQKKFVDFIRGPALETIHGLGDTVAKTLFPGVTAGITAAFSPSTIQALNQLLGQTGQILGGIAEQWGKFIGSSAFSSAFSQLANSGLQFAKQMSSAFLNLFKALANIGIAAVPLLNWIGQMTIKGTQFLNLWTGSHQAAMSGFFDQTRQAVIILAQTLGNLVKIVFQLMEVLAPLGNLLFNQINVALSNLADWLQKNRTEIQNVTLVIGRDLIGVIKTLWTWLMKVIDDVLKPMVTTLIKLGDQLSSATFGFLSMQHAVEGLIALAVVDWIAGVSVALVSTLIPAIIAVTTNPAFLALIAGLTLLSQYKNGFGQSTNVTPGASPQTKMDIGKANFGGGIVGEIYYDQVTKQYYAVGAAGTMGGAESFTKDLTPKQVAKQLGISPAALKKRVAGSGTGVAGSGSQGGNTHSGVSTDSSVYKKMAADAAASYGLPVDLFLKQINQESGFNPNAVSSAGAIGIAQFMPGTAKGFGINPKDPKQALPAAAKMMAQLYAKYHDYGLALAAYNAGSGTVDKFLSGKGSLPAETVSYVKAITGAGPTGYGSLPSFTPGAGGDPFTPTSGSGTANTPGQAKFAKAQAKYLTGTAQGTTPQQNLSAAKEYLATLKDIQKTVKTTGGTNVQNLAAQREITTLVSAENAAKKEIAKSEKAIATAKLATKELGILGVSGGSSTSTMSATAQLKAIKSELSNTSGLSTPAIQSQVDKLNRVLSLGIANPTVRQAVSSSMTALKQTIADRLAGIKSAAQTAVQDATSALTQGLSGLTQAADNAFTAATNAQVTAMGTALTANLANLQTMVTSAAGNFLFGGSITQTPAELAITGLQQAHDVQQRTLALTQAQQNLVLANATGNPQNIFDAQQGVADAQFNIQVAGLQDQATVQRTAADAQLKAAQDAYQLQQQALIDNFATQRGIQQTAMDQQIAEYISDVEKYPANASIYLGKIVDVFTANGIPMEGAAFALGGKIYSGLNAAIGPGSPLDALITDLINKLATLAGLPGGSFPTGTAGADYPAFTMTTTGQTSFTAAQLAIIAALPINQAPDALSRYLPHLAAGGIVSTPTIALLGENGPEMVMPLGNNTAAGTLHVTHNITVELDKRQVATAVREEFIRLGRSNKSIFSGPGVNP